MIKNNKGKRILSSIVTLLPMLFALCGKWLPEEIAVHWGADGTANGFASPVSFFLTMPPILLAVHWLCLVLTTVIDKKNEQNKKVTGLIFWIIPTISLFCCGIVFAIALGYTANILSVVFLLLAVMFIVIGNYMPKITRNLTMGIKIKWTLSSDENWRATHRFAGKLYVILGILCLPAMLLPEKAFPIMALALILLCAALPVVYSYRFYRKQLSAGTATKEEYEAENPMKNQKMFALVSVILAVVLAIVVAFLMLTGDVETTLGEASFTVKADFWEDLTLRYEEVDAIEYRAAGVDGERIWGYGSARLLLGHFENDEFGAYTRYTYTGSRPCVVLTVDQRTVVIGARNEETVKGIYERILAEISQ